LSNRPTAGWIGAHDDFQGFREAVFSGAGGASEEQARHWFGYHALHEIVDPSTMNAAEILDRVDRPFSRERLPSGLALIESHQRQLDLAA
jgi:hypothetical protein